MTISSELFGNLYSTAEMREIFSDKETAKQYLHIERTLATVQAELGIIPTDAATAINDKARSENMDWQAWTEGVANSGVPTIPMVKQIVAAVGELGQWAHYGATTQDIMDTAVVLQVQAALAIVSRDLAAIEAALVALAREHKDTAMVGRSQLQQALPITFGLKAAGWLSSIRRHQERLGQLTPRVLVGQFGGAVGTLASLGQDGLAVQKALCEALGIGVPVVSWHTARDNLTEVVSFLGLVSGTLAKIGLDIALMAQNEVGEVAEPGGPGRGGSSTMPQKRNPISSQRLLTSGRLIRQQVATMMEGMVNDHERGTGIWTVEWVALPESFLLISVALAEARTLLEGLKVFPERMEQNLALSNGMLTSEAVMMALAPHIGRANAHHLVKEAVQNAMKQRTDLKSALLLMEAVTDHLDEAELAMLTDPANYTGLASTIVDHVLGS